MNWTARAWTLYAWNINERTRKYGLPRDGIMYLLRLARMHPNY